MPPRQYKSDPFYASASKRRKRRPSLLEVQRRTGKAKRGKWPFNPRQNSPTNLKRGNFIN